MKYASPVSYSIFALCLLSSQPALPAATDWQDLGGGKARMAAVLDPTSGEVSAVVEMQLEEGWKTYWRDPGDSGIPPQFGFTSSSHFLPGEVAFPVPHVVEAGGSVFAGYHGTVRFPFKGQFATDRQDGVIRLDLLAGVCEEICIPATAQFEIAYAELLTSDFESLNVISEAYDTLPGQATEDFRILGAYLVDGSRLVVETRLPDPSSDTEFFIENPPGWYIAPSRHVGAGPDLHPFEIKVGKHPEGGTAGIKLRFVVRNGNKGIEQWVTLSD